jgi:hypothetical protein
MALKLLAPTAVAVFTVLAPITVSLATLAPHI